MKDLDFDELDRAVNSLMTNVPKSAPQPSETGEKTLDLSGGADSSAAVPATPASMPVDTAVSPDTSSRSAPVVSTPAPRSESVPARSTPPMPAARRGGRFMDVVHPSSDMKKSEPARPVSRQGATIEPTAAAESQPQAAPVEPSTDVTEVPQTTPAVDTAPEPAKSPSSMNEWPDPLDMPVASSIDSKSQDDSGELNEPDMQDTSEKPEAPLTSPFLPGAKVEKRPLGSAATPEEDMSPAAAQEEEPEEKMPDEADNQLSAKPEDVELQLPEELQGDLMAVEADTTHDKLKEVHEAKANKKEEVVKKPVSSATEASKSDDTSPVPAGPTSIPQQYREEPSTSDQKNGAIYDTDTYHQPLQHPAKKRASWLWMVWIALILLLGGAGGAAIYFLGLV